MLETADRECRAGPLFLLLEKSTEVGCGYEEASYKEGAGIQDSWGPI